MHPSRRQLMTSIAAGAAGAVLPTLSALAQVPGDDEIDEALRNLLYRSEMLFRRGIDVIERYDNADLAPSLITALRFSPNPDDIIVAQLARLTGETDAKTWFDWMLWQEKNAEIIPHSSMYSLKNELWLNIDQNFAGFFKTEYLDRDRMKIRFEEITWGGVRKDGIPSLDNPTMIDAVDADYLLEDDLVFGVAINGDVRAYPLRIMGWHEMFNDVIGGVPLALAYCTLCGSGILFETNVEGRDKPFVFGSSGFLYRSNKLMFDRETESLWNQFTGKPVMGPLVESGIELKQRPVVITPWYRWRDQNPDTKVLSLQTGHRRNYGSGVVYRDYFTSPDLMFPVLVDQENHKQKDYVFGVRTIGASKAWPLKAFGNGRVINDGVGALPLVLVGDESGRTVRAYERGDRTFEAGDSASTLVSDGANWSVTEEALIAPDGTKAPRVAGHIAYWFAWNGYLGAESEIYEG